MRTLVRKLAKGYLFARLVGLIITRANFLFPGKRLATTTHWFAIRHPQPAYPVHILILPRYAIPDWMSLQSTDPVVYAEFIELSQRLIREEGLEEKGYRLIVNGGEYQSIRQLHVHLVCGDPFKQE